MTDGFENEQFNQVTLGFVFSSRLSTTLPKEKG
jgi:hypothetical protein